MLGPDSGMEGINRLHGNGREDLRESSNLRTKNREQKTQGTLHLLTANLLPQQSPSAQRA